jgi:hypothetical protein
MPVIPETPLMSDPSPFQSRCKSDPQGVIKDLLACQTRQAKTIHKRGLQIEELDGELTLFLTVLKKIADQDIIDKFEKELTKRKNKKKK